MAFAALLAIALIELGPPWDELDLSASQRDRVTRVLLRYRPQIEALEGQIESRSGAARSDAERRLRQLTERRDQEASRALPSEQRAKYEEIRRWMTEGVPLGQGLFRSYDFVESGPVRDGVERPDKLKFELINRGPQAISDVQLEVKFVDRDGDVIHSERPHVDRLEPGKSTSVVVRYQLPRQTQQRAGKPQIELISAQPLP